MTRSVLDRLCLFGVQRHLIAQFGRLPDVSACGTDLRFSWLTASYATPVDVTEEDYDPAITKDLGRESGGRVPYKARRC